jgi:hypothetical protein
MSDIVQKLWGFCHTLRHDGVDYGDYIEQLTYLLFLKMADERGAVVPKGFDWNTHVASEADSHHVRVTTRDISTGSIRSFKSAICPAKVVWLIRTFRR